MDKKKFAQRFKEILEESEKEQKEIAKKLNVTPANISNWKTGRNVPSIETLYDICILFEKSADYLLGLEDEFGSKTYNNYGIHNGNVKF